MFPTLDDAVSNESNKETRLNSPGVIWLHSEKCYTPLLLESTPAKLPLIAAVGNFQQNTYSQLIEKCHKVTNNPLSEIEAGDMFNHLSFHNDHLSKIGGFQKCFGLMVRI